MVSSPPSSSSSPPSSLIVIGAGLPRTGTASLKAGLEILLKAKCYHMHELLNIKGRHILLWNTAVKHGLTKSIADEIMEDYRAAVDYPASHFYEELSRIYPNAKIILTVRDPAKWALSVKNTVFQIQSTMENQPMIMKLLTFTEKFGETLRIMFSNEFGENFLKLSDSELIEKFNQHNDRVMKSIPADRLLKFQVADGWKPLCDFLECDIPNQPFPRVNDTNEFQQKTKPVRIIVSGLNIITNTVCVVVVAVVAYKLFHYYF